MQALTVKHESSTWQLGWNGNMTGNQLRATISDHFGIPSGSFQLFVVDPETFCELFVNPTGHATKRLVEIGITYNSTINVITKMEEGSLTDPRTCPSIIWKFKDETFIRVPSVRVCPGCSKKYVLDLETVNIMKGCRIQHCTNSACLGHFCWFCLAFDKSSWTNFPCGKAPHDVFGRCPNKVKFLE